MNKNTLNHCLKFSLPFIIHHICYGKSELKFLSMTIKLKLVVSNASNNCFKSFNFFQMLLASPNYLKYLTSLLSLKESKDISQVGSIQKFPLQVHNANK